MRIFFDTEFTQFRDGELLSIGFVSEADHELVVEIHDEQRHARASEFCKTTVIPQFGLVRAHKVGSDAKAGAVIADWLLGFDSPLVLCYDYKLDWRFFEEAIRAAGEWALVSERITPLNVADFAKYDSCLQVQDQNFLGESHPGRHHPLVDARAMRERWREYERLEAQSNAAIRHQPQKTR